jgi:ribose transport system permease protein
VTGTNTDTGISFGTVADTGDSLVAVEHPAIRAVKAVQHRLRATGTIFLILLAIIVWISILNHNFTDPAVMLNFVRRATPLLVLAAGQMFVVATGGLDLSVGSTVTVTVVIAARWIDGSESATWFVIPALIAMGAVIGLINGLIVTKLKVPSFITTLGMLLILAGAIDYWTGGAPRGALPDSFRQFGIEGWDMPVLGRLPYAVAIVAVVGTIAWYLLHHTSFGHQILAVGGGARTSRLSGVEVHRVRILAFVLSGIAAVIAGILLGGIGGVSAQIGQGLEFRAIAAVVLGGTALAGGRASAPAAIVGALTLEAVFTLLNLLGYSEGMRDIVQGVIIVAAVGSMSRREFSRG